MSKKETAVILRKVRRQKGRDGKPLFMVEKRRSGHYRVTARNGRWVTFPCTPSGGNRSIRNTVADLRRLGVDL